MEGIGYYDGQGSLFDMQLCCVITLMKSEDDLNPYTFTLPLNPIQKENHDESGRKDKMTLYMLRNAFSTLLIAFCFFYDFFDFVL